MRDRKEIIKLLTEMDDESFSNVVLAIPSSAMMYGGRTQIWPDGTGGYKDKEKIEKIRKAAQRWLDESSGR